MFAMNRTFVSVLVVLVVSGLVEPIYCEFNEEESMKHILENWMEFTMLFLWQDKCKEVTGMEYDFEELKEALDKYEACHSNTFKIEELEKDLTPILSQTLENLDKAAMFQFRDKYCSQFKASLNCEYKYRMINCYTAEEVNAFLVLLHIRVTLYDNFCENDAVIHLLDENILLCFMQHVAVILRCKKECRDILSAAQEYSDDGHILSSDIIKVDTICKVLDHVEKCAVRILDKCNVSSEIEDLRGSIFTNLLTIGKCAKGWHYRGHYEEQVEL